jgi:hypothetical protein
MGWWGWRKGGGRAQRSSADFRLKTGGVVSKRFHSK